MKRISFLLILSIFIISISIYCLASYSKGGMTYRITLSDAVINPVTAEYISNAIRQAEKDKAECLIIELDTPGGLLTSTRAIVKSMMASKVPIIVYVAPRGSRAGSAGVFITLAANIAAMAPSTNIGAAHPVALQKRRSLGDTIEDLAERFFKDDKKKGKKKVAKKPPKEPMEAKILNDTTAWVRTIAKARGKNTDWAVKAVTESVSITENQAVKDGVIDIVASDTKDLLAKIDGREMLLPDGKVVLHTKGVRVIDIPMGVRHKILMTLASPNIAYILLMLGLYGLLFEFTHPGVGFPGVAGTMSVIVALYGLHLVAANYAGIALIILGIILFIMEVRIVSYGLLTLGGVVCLFLGSLMLFDSPYEFMRVSLPLVLAFTISTLLIAIFLVTIVLRLHRRRVTTGKEGMIGIKAEVKSWKGKRGKVFVHGELWNANGEMGFQEGDAVEIVKVKGMKLIVK